MEYAIAVIAVLIVLAVVVYHSKIAAAAKAEADRLRAQLDARLHLTPDVVASAPAADPTPTAPAPVVSAPAPVPAVPTLGVTDALPPVNPGEGLVAYANRVGYSGAPAELTVRAAAHPGESWDIIVDRARNPGKYMTQSDIDTMTASSKNAQTMYHGPVAASQLTHEDRVYLDAMINPYRNATGGRQIHFDVLSGSQLEINQAINEPQAAEVGSYNVDNYHGILLGVVQATMTRYRK